MRLHPATRLQAVGAHTTFVLTLSLAAAPTPGPVTKFIVWENRGEQLYQMDWYGFTWHQRKVVNDLIWFLWWKSCSSFRLYFFCPVQAYKNLEAVRLDRMQGNAMGEFPLLSRPFPFSFLLPSICLHPIPLGKAIKLPASEGSCGVNPVVVSEKYALPESLSLSLSSLSASASSPSFSLPFSDSLSDSSMISVAVSPEVSFLTTKPLDLLNSCMLSWGVRSTTGALQKNWNSVLLQQVVMYSEVGRGRQWRQKYRDWWQHHPTSNYFTA